jgi:response regulator NasT
MRAQTIRVWLVDECPPAGPSPLATLLRDLTEQLQGALRLLGSQPFAADYAALVRSASPDVLVLHAPAWPEGPGTEETLAQGWGVLVVGDAAGSERFRALAESYPLVFITAAPSAELLWLGVQTASAARQRHAQLRGEVDRLQQRLTDRIVIERAKGVLCQRLRISEDEAYNRLRVLSRRQRRQVRDVAQALLDAERLLVPGGNGAAHGDENDPPESGPVV